MIRLDTLDDPRLRENRAPSCVVVGVFDGVHRGHKSLLAQARELARAKGPEYRVAALTFQNHPLSLLRPAHAPTMLLPLERRLECLAQAGVDLAVAVRFDAAFAAIEAERFVREVLVETLGAARLICGPDFRFGRGGAGTADLAQRIGGPLGLEIFPAAPVLEGGEPVSSSRIRRLVREGQVAQAAQLLGRPHELEGVVVEGRRRGRELGFPTANLRPEDNLTLPETGVYAVEAVLPGENGAAAAAEAWPGMMNLGYSPTFGDIEEPRIETHLIGFSGELTGRRLRLRLLERLRGEERFASVDELKSQLARDKMQARAVYALWREGEFQAEG